MTSILITMKKPVKHSAIALAILTMLYEEPMHPYRMQQLIKDRGEDEGINLPQRQTHCHTINRPEREKLIHPQRVSRYENRPDRTVYELTDQGRKSIVD